MCLQETHVVHTDPVGHREASMAEVQRKILRVLWAHEDLGFTLMWIRRLGTPGSSSWLKVGNCHFLMQIWVWGSYGHISPEDEGGRCVHLVAGHQQARRETLKWVTWMFWTLAIFWQLSPDKILVFLVETPGSSPSTEHSSVSRDFLKLRQGSQTLLWHSWVGT